MSRKTKYITEKVIPALGGILAALAFIAIMTVAANSQVIDGPHFRHVCFTNTPGERGACAGFISGVIDASPRPHQFCIPNAVPPETVIGRTVDYLASNQQIAELPGDQQVTLALKALWPCVERQQQATIPFQAPPLMNRLLPGMINESICITCPECVICDCIRRRTC